MHGRKNGRREGRKKLSALVITNESSITFSFFFKERKKSSPRVVVRLREGSTPQEEVCLEGGSSPRGGIRLLEGSNTEDDAYLAEISNPKETPCLREGSTLEAMVYLEGESILQEEVCLEEESSPRRKDVGLGEEAVEYL